MYDFSKIGDLNLPNEAARMLAREIRERWPALRLVRLEPNHAEYTPQRPYAIIDTEPRTFNTTLRVYPESMLDHRLLAILIDQDFRNYGGMTPDRYWALEQAGKSLSERERNEAREAQRDFSISLLSSNKSTYKYHDPDSGELVTLRK